MNEPTSTENPLRFKPLTEGLGFHPFSNGLPYAPTSKSASSTPVRPEPPRPEKPWTGAGATVAGTPQFAFPKSNSLPRSNFAQTLAAANAQATLQPTITSAIIEAPETYGFAYLAARVMAFAIDSTIHTLLAFVAFFFAAELLEITPQILSQGSVIALTALFFMVFNWTMITAQEVTFGTTLGKRIFRLSIEGSPSTLFVRSILFAFSSSVLGLGLLWALFDRKRRCWHDVATEVQPNRLVRL